MYLPYDTYPSEESNTTTSVQKKQNITPQPNIATNSSSEDMLECINKYIFFQYSMFYKRKTKISTRAYKHSCLYNELHPRVFYE